MAEKTDKGPIHPSYPSYPVSCFGFSGQQKKLPVIGEA